MNARSTPAGDVFEQIVRDAVSSVLKPAGFRKTRTNFHRRAGTCVQVINLQSSLGASWDVRPFFINVGLAFDDICRLINLPILDSLKEIQCDDRGTRDRLENLISGVPPEWEASIAEDSKPIIDRLRTAMETLVLELDGINGLSTYRTHGWFDRFRPKRENAQILYLLGDVNGAREEVEHLARFFSDRKGASQPDWWIERLGLTGLRSGD